VGSLGVQASGGSPNYAYIWSNGATNANLTGLFAGTYRATVTDQNGCTQSLEQVVNLPIGNISVTISSQNNRCAGQGNGSISAQTTGGTAPYTYQWSTGSSSSSLTGLSAGSYILTVTDNSSGLPCRVINQIQISEPLPLAITLDSLRHVDCAGNANGLIWISASGGQPAYTYAWSNGASVEQIENLSPGSYTLSLSDANGCLFVAPSFSISQPDTLEAALDAIQAAGCGNGANQGQIDVLVLGGTAPYTYQWSNGASTQDLSNLGVGQYQLSLSDANGCQASLQVSLGNGVITVSLASAVDSICFGATTGSLVAQSNVPTADYRWSNGASTANISGLSAGSYQVTASTTAGGQTCEDTLTVVIHQPNAPLSLSLMQQDSIACDLLPLASLTAQALDGWGQPYEYRWNTGSLGDTLRNLGPGVYSATVLDALACSSTASITVTAPQIPQLNAWVGSSGQNNITVAWGNTVELNAGFNETGVNYQWIPGTNLNPNDQAQAFLNAVQSGNLVYVVEASVGACAVTDTVQLTVIATYTGIPDAFTPNGDGLNDIFRPIDLNPAFIKTFKIYNRWGQTVYDDPQLGGGGWDGTLGGKEQPRDVYMFVLEFQRPQDAQLQQLRGEVTLIR
jgi:gliding motility-associated-like protein